MTRAIICGPRYLDRHAEIGTPRGHRGHRKLDERLTGMADVPSPSVAKTAPRSFQFDWARVRWPEWVVAGSALVLLVVMLVVNWYTVTLVPSGVGRFPVQINVNGWDGAVHLRWLMLVTIVAGFALFLFQGARRAPAIPVTLSLVVTALGGLTVIWLFVRVAIDPPGGRDLGGWVGLVAAAALTWGAFRSLKMEGISPTDAPAHIPMVSLAPAEADPRPSGDDPPPSSDDPPPSADRS